MTGRLLICYGIFVWGILLGPADSYAKSELIYEDSRWTANRHYSDETQEFTRCSAGSGYRSGINLLISLSRDMDLELWLQHDTWELDEGAEYPVRLQVDEYSIVHAGAETQTSKMVYIHVRNGDWFYDLLRKGNELFVYAQDDTMGFQLIGSHKALGKMKACTLDALEAEKKSRVNPFAQGGMSSAMDGTAPEKPSYTRAGPDDPDAKAFAMNALMMPTLRHYERIPDAQRSKKLKEYPVTWKGAGVLGIIERLGGLALNDLATTLALEISLRCESTFDSAQTPFVLPDGGAGIQVQILCHKEDGYSHIVSLYPANVGGYYAVGSFAADPELAMEADRFFHEAVTDMLRGF